jgi:hypothetical protein
MARIRFSRKEGLEWNVSIDEFFGLLAFTVIASGIILLIVAAVTHQLK